MACASSRIQLTFSLCLALVLALFPQTAYAHSSADLPPTDIPALAVRISCLWE